MFKFNLIGAVVGFVLIVSFVGFLGVWLKSWPLSIIIIFVVGLMAYDIIKELRAVKESDGEA